MAIAGYASLEGTRRYEERAQEGPIDRGHFRTFEALKLSSVGAGTYPVAGVGGENSAEEALYRSISSGAVNVIDTAINYRAQKTERVVGRVLERLRAEDPSSRTGIFVSTKSGYLTSDADLKIDFWSYVQTKLVRPGILRAEDIAGDVHAMSAPFLRDQFERSLGNLGLETIDLVYLYNPAESWLPEIGYRRFMERLGDAFSYYEAERGRGRLRYYGLAGWNSLRAPKTDPHHINLDDVVDVARDSGGSGHGFRFVQLPLNPGMKEALVLANQRIADEHLTTLEAAHRLGLGVFTNTPFGEGLLLDDPSIPELLGSRALSLLQFARSAGPALIAPLVGHERPDDLRENLRIARVPPLTSREFARTYGHLIQQS